MPTGTDPVVHARLMEIVTARNAECGDIVRTGLVGRGEVLEAYRAVTFDWLSPAVVLFPFCLPLRTDLCSAVHAANAVVSHDAVCVYSSAVGEGGMDLGGQQASLPPERVVLANLEHAQEDEDEMLARRDVA